MAESILMSTNSGRGKGITDEEPTDELEAALERGNTGGNSYHFPSDLESIDHWMAIRIADHELLRKEDFAIDETLEYIFLPMPGTLGTAYNQDWQSDSLMYAGELGANMGQLSKGKGGIIKSVVSGAKQQVQSVKDAIASKGAGKSILDALDATGDFGVYYAHTVAEQAGSAAGAFVGEKIGMPGTGAVLGAIAQQFVKGAVAGAGLAQNPYMAQLYTAPQFRAHQFTWKFIPRDVSEVYALRKVIERLKLAQAPSENALNPHYFDYPNLFDIDFHYPDFLFNMGPSICKNISIEYHAENQPLYYDIPKNIDEDQDFSKAPVSVNLSMQLDEMFVITKEELRKEKR